MTTILQGSDAQFTVSVQHNGNPVSVTDPATASVYSMNGRTELVPAITITDPAGWPDGIVPVALTGAQTALLPIGDSMLVLAGNFGIRRFRLNTETLALGTRTSLFIKDIVVAEIRQDRLMAATAGILQDVQVSDDYLWEKVRAAESDIAHTLRVPLVPTRYFPIQPTAEELLALGDMAWEIEPGYDYEPNMFERDKWGWIVTRQRPVISVEYMRFAYPTQNNGFFDIPLDWLRVDNRAGYLRIVPTSAGMLTGTVGMSVLAHVNQNTVPAMVQLAYTAGLKDAEADYPELLDVIKKKAVLKIVGDAYLPQSGSISADGLSQSLSVDMSKYSDAIDETLNGPKGSNGGLMTRIHGIRTGIF